MLQWQERTRCYHSFLSSSVDISQNIGVKFRRYSAGQDDASFSVVVTVPPSAIHLPTTAGNVLTTSTTDLRKMLDELNPHLS